MNLERRIPARPERGQGESAKVWKNPSEGNIRKTLAGGRDERWERSTSGAGRQDGGENTTLAGGRQDDGWQRKMSEYWQDNDVAVEDCSHVYSDGTLVYGLFEGENERIAGMNLVAVTAISCNVKVLMAQIMTTHIHLIVSGNYIDRDRFSKELKNKLTRILIRKFPNGGCAISVSNDSISDERELKNKIMYVYRNAIAAGWKGMPWNYVGGPGDIFFVDHNEKMMAGRPLSDYPKYQTYAMFHSRLNLPEDWRVDERGLLLPHCWMDWQRVENLFRTPRAFIAFMHQSRDMETSINQECTQKKMENVKESELRVVCRKLCGEMFGKTILSKASMEERLAIARKVWSERLTYSTSALSRVTLLDKSLLESIFSKKM